MKCSTAYIGKGILCERCANPAEEMTKKVVENDLFKAFLLALFIGLCLGPGQAYAQPVSHTVPPGADTYLGQLTGTAGASTVFTIPLSFRLPQRPLIAVRCGANAAVGVGGRVDTPVCNASNLCPPIAANTTTYIRLPAGGRRLALFDAAAVTCNFWLIE